MKRLLSIIAILSIISCAPIYVNYDYETGTDFSKYKTYNMYPDMQTGLSELDTKRLLNSVDQFLQSKGFTVSDSPDFLVNISSNEYQSERRSAVGVGVGGSGRNVGGGINVGIPIGSNDINREMVFDFIDANRDSLIWQAISESSFNPNATPEKREERLKAIVTKVLSKYPPEN